MHSICRVSRWSQIVGVAMAALVLFWGAIPCADADDANARESVFVAQCAPCHGADGRARTPAARKLRVHDLTQSKLSEEGVRAQILGGWRDARGRTRMPAFKGKLSDEQIAALVDYVMALREE